MGTASLPQHGRSLGIMQTNQNDLLAGVKIFIVLGWLFLGLVSYIKKHNN